MEKRRYKELEIFTGIAILFVVIIHANAQYLNNFGIREYADMRLMFNTINFSVYPNDMFAWIFNSIDKIVHVAVPMFIFAAGFKFELNNKTENYTVYVKKKLNQVFKPFLTISLIVLLIFRLNTFLINQVEESNPILMIIEDIIKILAGYNFAYQLWYVPMYLFIVLSYPLIIKVLTKETVRITVFIVLALVWVIADAYFPIVKAFPYPLSFLYYFIMFELGAMYYRKQINNNWLIIFVCIGLVIVSMIIPLKYNVFYTEIIITPIAVMALFSVARKVNISLLSYLNKQSFYIFLFHEPFLVSGLMRLFKEVGTKNYFIVLPIVTVISIVLCVLLVKIIAFVPVLRGLLNIKSTKPKRTSMKYSHNNFS